MSAAWCLKDETNEAAEAVLAALGNGGGVVPALWAIEMANILVMAERRGRISPSDGERASSYSGACRFASSQRTPTPRGGYGWLPASTDSPHGAGDRGRKIFLGEEDYADFLGRIQKAVGDDDVVGFNRRHRRYGHLFQNLLATTAN